MAAEQPLFEITCIAAADLRLQQYHACRVVGWDAITNCYTVNLCGNGQKPIGILQNKPDINESANILVEGKSKAVIGAAVNFLDNWQSNALGQVISLGANAWSGGRFLTSAALSATPQGSELSTILVGCNNPWLSPAQFQDE